MSIVFKRKGSATDVFPTDVIPPPKPGAVPAIPVESGPPPAPAPGVFNYLSPGQRESRFGPVGTNIVSERIPALAHTNNDLVTFNREAMPSFRAIMHEIHSRGLSHLISSNDGTFVVREIRGRPGVMSSHSYGTSIDLNASSHPLGDVETTAAQDQIARIFVKHGWYWGGWFRTRPDPMHFEYIG